MVATYDDLCRQWLHFLGSGEAAHGCAARNPGGFAGGSEVLPDPAADVLGPDQVGGALDAVYRNSQVSPDTLSHCSSPVSVTSAFRSAVARIKASGIFKAL